MPYSITTQDGITIEGIPDDVKPDDQRLKDRVRLIRAQAAGWDVSKGMIPGAEPPRLRGAGRSQDETAVGIGEAALTAVTGGTGGLVGAVGGTLGGLAGAIRTGKIGTREGVRMVEEAASQGAQALTYASRTEAGREITEKVGQAVQQIAPPVLPQIAAPGMAINAVAQQRPLVAATAARAAAAAAPVVRRAGVAAEEAAVSAARRVGLLPPEQESMDAVSATASALSRGGVGATGAAQARERRAVAESMPVPFTGRSALTAGQASRNFSQLQFEKEAAKRADLGAPLRERVEQQTADMIRNFDALVDLPGPVSSDLRSMGRSVDRALVNRVEVMRRRIRDAYTKAREAGQMEDPADMSPLAARLAEIAPMEGLTPLISAVRKEAVRLGVLAQDDAGGIVPARASVAASELLRQFVNENTDWAAPRERLIAGRINASIDAATEGHGGPLYRAARRERERFADEFENVGLTAKLIGTKRGTTDRHVAFEDVFDKVIISSSVDEINKLRGTLLRAGPDGKQAWADLKAGGIRFIKDSSLSPSQRDSSGNPLLMVDRFHRAVNGFDADGKLEALYGKRQAQVLRDLASLATDIYTAPPGAINHSNTASALLVAMDSFATWATTGIPAPALTGLREGARYIKDRKTKARIEAALRGEVIKD